MGQKNNLLIGILIAVTVILLGMVLYLLVIRPTISGYTINAQNTGMQYAVGTIFQMAAQCQQVPLTFNNQTLTLVALECLQQPSQQTQQLSQQQTTE